jgi:hypothetical protein
VNSSKNIDDQEILNAADLPTSEVKVGIMRDDGTIADVITLEEMARVGSSQNIFFRRLRPHRGYSARL